MRADAPNLEVFVAKNAILATYSSFTLSLARHRLKALGWLTSQISCNCPETHFRVCLLPEVNAWGIKVIACILQIAIVLLLYESCTYVV